MMNDIDFAAKARLRKASLLVAALRAAGATVTMIDALGDEFPWDVATATAGVKPPSAETKELVRDTMLFLERRDRQIGDADPFEGL